jgi:nucleoside-diphosphate-sugar epimerase
MRVVVVGATGNVGTSVLHALADVPEVEEIVGVARSRPARIFAKTRFVAADITSADLVPLFSGAAAVIHLAWLIQPSRDQPLVRAVNEQGSQRVFQAVVDAGVPALVYASSVGAYSPGPKDREVDESWPTGGIATSFYSRHKVAVERMLDRLAQERPELRVVRMRPALIFKAQAATEIWRLFAGSLLPPALLRRRLVPFVPSLPALRFQAVHADDVAAAFVRAALDDHAAGAFNLAADPPLGPRQLAQVLQARPLRVPAPLLRAGAALAYRLRLTPTEPGWVDMGLQVPLMSSARARLELGWSPRHGALQTLAELVDNVGRFPESPAGYGLGMSADSKVTTDHDTIRRWAEERGGAPAGVRGPGQGDEVGVLRIDFPGGAAEDSLEHISWDAWFEKFDDEHLAFLYREEKTDGEGSTFFKLIER